MAYGDAAYESCVNLAATTQSLVSGQRTLFAVSGTSSWTQKFPQPRWNPATSAGLGMNMDEKLEIRWQTTYVSAATALALFTPFSLHFEFDIGTAAAPLIAAEQYWDVPSALGLLSLTATTRTNTRALPFYVGTSWIINGCKVFVTAVGSNVTLSGNRILISRTS